MAKISFDGLVDLLGSYERLARIPDSVLDEMLGAEAEVIAPTIKKTAETMLHGKYYQGDVAGSVTIKAPQTIKGQRIRYITFDGTAHKNRISEIAFINEYGKTNQNARPFILNAINQSVDEATDKAANILFNYEQSIGL